MDRKESSGMHNQKNAASEKVILWPHFILRKPTHQVTDFDEDLTQLSIDLFLVLQGIEGLGMAAPQIGDRRAVLIYKAEDEQGVMVNPEIVRASVEKEEDMEGCLSFPGVYINISRHVDIDVRFQDLEGQEVTRYFEGKLARVIQHEMDHLQGRTIVSYLSKLKRDQITAKMQKLQREIEQSEKKLRGAKTRALKYAQRMSKNR